MFRTKLTIVISLLSMLFCAKAMPEGAQMYGVYIDGEHKANYLINRSESEGCIVRGTIVSSGLLFDGVLNLLSRSRCIDGQDWQLEQYRESAEVFWHDVVINQFWVNADHIEYYTGRHSENQRISITEGQRDIGMADSLSVFFAVQDKIRRGSRYWQMSLVMPSDKKQPPVVERHQFSVGCDNVEPDRSVLNLVCAQSSRGTEKSYYWFDPARNWVFVGSLRGDRLIWQLPSLR